MDEELLQYYTNDDGMYSADNGDEFENDIFDDTDEVAEDIPTDLEDKISNTTLVPDGYTPGSSSDVGTPGSSIPQVDPPADLIVVPDPQYKTETITEVITITEYDTEYLLELKDNGFKFYANYTDGTKEEVLYSDIYDPIEANASSIVFTADVIGAASNQHFWNDTNGVHVSDNPKEDWEQNEVYLYDEVDDPVADDLDIYYELSGTAYVKTADNAINSNKTYYTQRHTLSDLNDTNYHNILMNSLGILLRKAYINFAMFSRANVAFFDGAGNNQENILAFFGALSAQIGRSNSNHVVITSNGVTAYKGDGTLDELTAIVDGANLKNATITSSKIANSTIENSNIKNGTITGAKIDSGTIENSNIKNGTITGAKIDNGTIENSNIKDGTITGSKIQGSTLTNIPYAEIDQLKTRNVTADAIQAATGFVASLATNSITAAKLVADQGIIDNLETNFAHIQNGVIDNANINVANVNGLSANYAHITNGVIDNAKIGHADVNGLSANYASVGALSAETARVDTLVANTADLATIRANAAKVTNLTAAELEADHATVGSLDTNYAQIDMANVNNAWIQNGTIKDAAISDGMINSVSANKLTAGTIDASNITVTNLNADNITTGTINGQRIGAGSLSLDKLSEDVYTETEVDSIVSNLQTQIDGAIETWTGTAIPTLQNAPASSWTTNSIKDTHVGDVYFIVNSQSNQNGYNYRFTKSGTGNNVTYSWQLIKDSDVTNALARLSTAEGKITTFDSDISQLKTDTGTLTTKTTSLETRMGNAEADILDKVDTTTFNEVSDTVDSHSQSITQMTTTLSNKADSSTVSSLTTRVSKNEQDISGINSTIGSLETTVESKADGSTVETISSKVNTISDTVDGHTQSISSITSTQTTIQEQLDRTIVETTQLWFSKADTTAPSKPTSQVTSTSTDGNAWRTVVPEYNESYPNYYYCYQWRYSDGTYGWSSVTRDIATGESQERARTAITNAATADTKAGNAESTANTAKSIADKNVKESQQLWFTKSDSSAPAKPTVKVTSTAVTGNSWTTKVPTYNASYPHYFYCMQYIAADGTVTWSDVVYDQATTEAQTVARTTSTNLSTLQQDYATFKQTTQQFESTVGSTYATKTELKTTDDKIENLESRVGNAETSITQTNNQIALKANASDVYTKTQTDGLISTEVTNRNSAINQKADAITASVANTYTNKTEFNSAKSEIKATTDGITSEVNKISSAKYVISATASWSLANIKTWSAEGYTETWSITSSANLRVGDTVYIKGTDSTRNCPVYIKVTVTGITSDASITGVSHGYEDVLPVETIKSTINQSSDSVKIQAKHVDIEGAAIFSSGRLSSEALNSTYDKKGTAEKVVSDFDKQIIDKLDSSIIETIQLWTISSTSSNPTKPSTPIFINAELSDTYLDNSGNTILDSSGNVINSITWTIIKPSYDLTKPYYYYCYQYKHYDGSYTWSDVCKDNALSSAASESVSEEQYVYISKASGTNSVASNTTWVAANSDSQNTWTTKRPTYNSSYPVLFIAKQRKTVSGVVTCTTPVKDDTTTIIDGGHITTGTIDASQVTVTNLDASEIKTGSLSADRIKANVISAVNNGTGTINADKINASALSIGYSQLTNTPAIPTKVSQLANDSDFVNADQLSTVIDGQNSVNDRVDESIVNTKILYTTRDVSTLPDAPNTPIISDSNISGAYLDSSSNSLLDSSGNAIMSKTWTVSRPSYSQEEPYYFYCYQYEHADGSYTWSNVMRDDATNESFKILTSRVEVVCSSIDYNNSTASLQAKLYVDNVETSGNQYQWFRDGLILANQNNQVLLVTSSMGINHLYSCTVDY